MQLQQDDSIQVAVSMADRIHVVDSTGDDIQELQDADNSLDTDADTETEQWIITVVILQCIYFECTYETIQINELCWQDYK